MPLFTCPVPCFFRMVARCLSVCPLCPLCPPSMVGSVVWYLTHMPFPCYFGARSGGRDDVGRGTQLA